MNPLGIILQSTLKILYKTAWVGIFLAFYYIYARYLRLFFSEDDFTQMFDHAFVVVLYRALHEP